MEHARLQLVMLPDFPETKELMWWHQQVFMESVVASLIGEFAAMPQAVRFEGRRVVIQDAEGTTRHAQPRKLEAQFEIKPTNGFGVSDEQVMDALRDMAKQLAKQRIGLVLSTVESSAQSVGNVFKYPDGALTPGFILDTLERIEIPFDSHGRPTIPQLFGAEDARDEATTVLNEIQIRPELQERYRSIIDKKYSDWTAREADRELVG